MNKEEFALAMTVLGTAYNKEFTSEQVTIWYEFFYETPIELFKTAIKRIIPKSKFIPSIADIKQEIVVMNNPFLQLNAEKEWEQVIDVVRKYGSYRADEGIKTLNPYTKNIVNLIGFTRICMSSNSSFERKQFIDLFNSYKENDEKILKLDKPQMTIAEIKRIADIKQEEKLLIGDKNENE